MGFCWKNTIKVIVACHQHTIDTQNFVITFSGPFTGQNPVGSFMLRPKERTGKI